MTIELRKKYRLNTINLTKKKKKYLNVGKYILAISKRLTENFCHKISKHDYL